MADNKKNPPQKPTATDLPQSQRVELHEGLDKIDIYARWTEATSFFPDHGKKNTTELVYLAMGLAGETGEFVDVVKKMFRDNGLEGWEKASDEQRLKLFDELSDVIWYLARTLIFFGVRFEGLTLHNMVKLRERMIEKGMYTEENIPWPNGLELDAALKLMQRIECHITDRSASQSTDTDTSSKPH